MNWRNAISWMFLLSLSIYPKLIFAADPPCVNNGGKICNPIAPIDDLPKLIKAILEGALKIGVPIVALAIIWSGFLFVKAQGNSEKLSQAKKAFMYSIIGAAILLGSWALAKLITETVISVGTP